MTTARHPLRVAMFVGCFPLVSETFILRQITGLMDLGHEVDIFSQLSPQGTGPVHPDVFEYELFERTMYLDTDVPPESGYWQMPVWPITGETWIPGAAESISNTERILRALPILRQCLDANPELLIQVLDPDQYGHGAVSLASLYHLGKLLKVPGKYDVIHAHFGPVANGIRFLKDLWKVPFVVSFHGYDFSTVPRQQGRTVYGRLFPAVDAVTVNSNHTRERLHELGCPQEKVHHLPMGLPLHEFPFATRTLEPGEEVRILTVARLVEIKGHEYSLRAFAKLRGKYPEVHYDIVGDGPLRPSLKALVRELGIESAVTLHGAQAGPVVRQLMSRAHLFLLGSVNVQGDQEGQGLVLQEAQATGLPVIATDHGAFPEGIIPGTSGFLVPERDVDALAERLCWLIDHREQWPEIGRQGRGHVEKNYDIRSLNRRLVALYSRLIERKLDVAVVRQFSFHASARYWEERYAQGGNSGAGSFGHLAVFKAEFLNAFVRANDIRSVIEFGCGDGNQLGLARYLKYTGIDVSDSAIRRCRTRYANDTTRQFLSLEEFQRREIPKHELSLSLDVIYHLMEDEVFTAHMGQLFAAATRFVVIYSSNFEAAYLSHIRHRRFTDWVELNEKNWVLKERVPNKYPFKHDDGNTSWSDFFIYEPA
jgi:colanic acid/amylovoran biosynthesis glycosyltransferase